MLEKGLTEEQVIELRKKYGLNEIVGVKKKSFIYKIIHIICAARVLIFTFNAGSVTRDDY